jgi:putative peptidoglycan lipid II flippase
MTTPGHRARPSAADGGQRPPGTGLPPGNGSPTDEDTGPAGSQYRGYDGQEYESPDYEPATGQFPVYGPLDADYTLTLPVIPGREWPRYSPGDDGGRGHQRSGSPGYGTPDGQSGQRPAPAEPMGGEPPPYPSYGPPSSQHTGHRPGADQYQYGIYPPAQQGDPGYQSPGSQSPGYEPASDYQPGDGPPQYADPGYQPPGSQYRGYGSSADVAEPEPRAWDAGAGTRGRHAGGTGTAGPAEAYVDPRTQFEGTWGTQTEPEAGWGPQTGPEAAWAPQAEPEAAQAYWDPRGYPPAQEAAGGPVTETPTAVLRQPAAPAPAGASLLRSSSTMALGTVASRVTGFVRSAVLIYAIGTGLLGDAYNISNTLPNVVYQFALGGIFTSVVVPLLVNAAKRNSDRGEAYDQRIFTLGVLALGGVTVVATALAWPITAVYASGLHNATAYHLTVILAYFFIPQIFFYGVSSLAGAVLNARGSFAAPMWTPVINNVVVILVGLMFIATAGVSQTRVGISGGEVLLLGIGTTLGIVLQTVAMIPSLRRVGFRWHPRYDFRRAEVSEIGRMSGWMFGYVLTTQIGFLVTTVIANNAGSNHDPGAGFAAYSNAYMLFQLPYAIVGISVITAMLPRMSAHASEGRYRNVAADFSTATRLSSVIVVPASLILAVLGGPLAEGLFGYGSTSAANARYIGEIFAVFSLGLLPYMLFQLLLRVFYAMHDSRTPATIGLVTMTINIVTNLIALAVLPPQHVVAGLGAGFGIANLVGSVIAWRKIGGRIGGLDDGRIRSSLVRMYMAAIPGAIFAIAVVFMVNAIIPGGKFGALLTVVVGGCGALLMYVVFAKAAGVSELTDLTDTVRARLR